MSQWQHQFYSHTEKKNLLSILKCHSGNINSILIRVPELNIYIKIFLFVISCFLNFISIYFYRNSTKINATTY